MNKDKSFWDNLYYSLRDMTSAVILIVVIVTLAGIRIANLEKALKSTKAQAESARLQIVQDNYRIIELETENKYFKALPEDIRKATATCASHEVPETFMLECMEYELSRDIK